MPHLRPIRIEELCLDAGIQSRAELDEPTIEDYAESMLAGDEFPPIIVFSDGHTQWVADGFHRVAAGKRAGRASLRAQVHVGTSRDAVLHAVGSNALHGRRRTNADKRRAVTLLLTDNEWGRWSDHEIARRCAVSQPFVGKVRRELSDNGSQSLCDSRLYRTRHGTEALMEVGRINLGRSNVDHQRASPGRAGAARASAGTDELSTCAPSPRPSVDEEKRILWQAREIRTRRANERRQAREARRTAAMASAHPLAGKAFRLLVGDVEEAGRQLPDESVDAIITDPQYGRDHLPVYERLGLLASRVLKVTGHLVVMVGQAHLPRIIDALVAGHGLTYRWTLAYLTPSRNTQVFERRLASTWKPVLWLMKDAAGDGAFIQDVVRPPPDDDDKRAHEWGQSEGGFATLVERFTVRGDLVLDPFCGAGTTGVAAVRLGRLFIGIDNDESAVVAAAARLSSLGLGSSPCAATVP